MKPARPGRILVVLGILFIPALSYYLISRGKNNFRKLEIYGPREVAATREGSNLRNDTLYHTIPPFVFTDQHGRTVNDSTFDNSFSVVNFFFTRCTTICPEMNRLLQGLQAKFRDNKAVRIISITVDPERDSVPVLAEYAKKHMALDDKWYFLTGDKEAVYQLARNGFFLAAIQNSDNKEEFTHSDQLVLVDKDKRIRGYYDGTDAREVERLKDEIIVLDWEYKTTGGEDLLLKK